MKRLIILALLPLLGACRPQELQPLDGSISVDVSASLETLVGQEDTDGDRQITIKDAGPRSMTLTSADGARSVSIEGTYPLSNLLQELALATDGDSEVTTINLARLFEHPVARISRMIKDYYWDGLTRRIDAEGLSRIAVDTKSDAVRPRIYVPATDPTAYSYFSGIASETPDLDLDVVRLPREITPEYVRSINDRPGILVLGLQAEGGTLSGIPFVVPGGRFNEMYGWDSYFEALGLLQDGRVDLAKSMVDNFVYEITHYGRILNANRSYYLTRSQPPFLTAMATSVFDAMEPGTARDTWFRTAILTAIHEYEAVWTGSDRLTRTGLSRYYGAGIGKPPETERGHYDAHLAPYAEAAGVELESFTEGYLNREIISEELDAYFVHDRTVRESGHDTSYRLEGRAASLNTVDLNSLLYRYELDIANAIETVFEGELEGHTPSAWRARAHSRRELVDSLLWDADAGWYFDYDYETNRRTGFQSATALYPLWAGMASAEQAARLVANALPALETVGGIASTSSESTGQTGPDRPQRQWDYPYGWAPHQMLIWKGLADYGFSEDSQRLTTKWLTMIARNARDFNGTIPEKYDVVLATHDVFVEYGNVGTQFDYITREGFGWMNASFQVGLASLEPDWLERLKADTDF